MPLEHLRIVREAAACQRGRPDSPSAVRRRDDAILFAARHHSLEEVAEAAELPPEEVDSMLSIVLSSDSAPESAQGLRTRFRSSPA
jgi:hypothetical protein